MEVQAGCSVRLLGLLLSGYELGTLAMVGGTAGGPEGEGSLCQAYPSTPEGSEVDELEYANSVAERLFWLARTSQIKDRPYQRCATWLDTIPGAGEYFRCQRGPQRRTDADVVVAGRLVQGASRPTPAVEGAGLAREAVEAKEE